MKINHTMLVNVYQNPKRYSYAESAQTAAGLDNPVAGKKEDQVLISPEGSFKSQVASDYRKMQPDHPDSKIERIRWQLQNDSYHISSTKVADAILNRVFGK